MPPRNTRKHQTSATETRVVSDEETQPDSFELEPIASGSSIHQYVKKRKANETKAPSLGAEDNAQAQEEGEKIPDAVDGADNNVHVLAEVLGTVHGIVNIVTVVVAALLVYGNTHVLQFFSAWQQVDHAVSILSTSFTFLTLSMLTALSPPGSLDIAACVITLADVLIAMVAFNTLSAGTVMLPGTLMAVVVSRLLMHLLYKLFRTYRRTVVKSKTDGCITVPSSSNPFMLIIPVVVVAALCVAVGEYAYRAA